MTTIHKELAMIIERVAYPIDRDALIEYVRIQGTGDDVVAQAEALPHRTYENPADVRRELELLPS